jgi:endonuclease YncB( thermonuclease family)
MRRNNVVHIRNYKWRRAQQKARRKLSVDWIRPTVLLAIFGITLATYQTPDVTRQMLVGMASPAKNAASEAIGGDIASDWDTEEGVHSNALTSTSTDDFNQQFELCSNGGGDNCVIDGDTIRYEGRNIRIADINTPETGNPDCEYEAALGQKATDRLLQLLNDGQFSLASIDRDQDRYGRDLRIVTRDGESLGQTLVDEGLAEEWQGYRKDWCS